MSEDNGVQAGGKKPGDCQKPSDWKYFLGFSVRVLAFFLLLFGVAFGMFWLRRNLNVHH